MRQTVVFHILLSCFYYGSSANLIERFQEYSCEEQILPKPPCCGIGKESAAPIIGGTPAEEKEFPWMVNFGGCGGSLINSRWVLTAGHCIGPNSGNVVYFGAKDIRIKQKLSPKENLNLYLRYSYDDIALLQLEEPVTFSDAIKPICLPTAVDQELGGRTAVVAGWRPHLLKKTIEIWSRKDCEEFTGYGYNLSSKYVICAGRRSNSSCGGDSDGPLFLKLNDENNRGPYYQVGVFAFDNVVCTEKYFPPVYTNVVNYIKWIEDTMIANQYN